MSGLRIMVAAAGFIAAAGAYAGTPAECVTEGYTPDKYEVYVDQPTGFSFVKTPCGWRFVRTIEDIRVAEAVLLTGSRIPEALQLASQDAWTLAR